MGRLGMVSWLVCIFVGVLRLRVKCRVCAEDMRMVLDLTTTEVVRLRIDIFDLTALLASQASHVFSTPVTLHERQAACSTAPTTKK